MNTVSVPFPIATMTQFCNQGERRRDSERGEEEWRGSGFSAALYPNPGFGNRMRRMWVRTNKSNNSTDMGLVDGGEQLSRK